MTNDKADDRWGLSTRLLVLFLAMVVAGFAIPSPGVAGDDDHADRHRALLGAGCARRGPWSWIVPEIALRAPIVPIEIATRRPHPSL